MKPLQDPKEFNAHISNHYIYTMRSINGDEGDFLIAKKTPQTPSLKMLFRRKIPANLPPSCAPHTDSSGSCVQTH